jgi:hypothetical protein
VNDLSDQHALTVIVPVPDEKIEGLRALLNAIGQNITNPGSPGAGSVKLERVRDYLPPSHTVQLGPHFIEFGRLTTVHFLRWVLLDPARDATGGPIAASLAFSTDYDGPFEEHMNELVLVAEPALRTIYSFCDPPPRNESLRTYLLAHRQPEAAFYRGHPGRSTQQILTVDHQSEEELRLVLELELDRVHSTGSAGPATIVEGLRQATGRSGWKSAPSSGRPPGIATGRLLLVALAGLTLLGILYGIGTHLFEWIPARVLFTVLVPLVAFTFLAAVLNLLDRIEHGRERRLVEREGPPTQVDGSIDPFVADRSDVRLRMVTELEDRGPLVQNQMTHVANIKPGMFRLALLRAVLATSSFLTRTLFVRGTLTGLSTIHFARWVLIDDNRRLLFFSNYDFSWESYLGDFIDQASDGLTGIWCNTTFFPRARFHTVSGLVRLTVLVLRFLPWFSRLPAVRVFEGGARREQAFKRWTRDHQVPTQVWYSAYPRLSVTNVNGNTEIAHGLFVPLTGDAQAAWLRRL